MRPLVVGLVVLATAGNQGEGAGTLPFGPADAVRSAHEDASRLAPDARPYVRHVSMHDVPAPGRAVRKRVVDFTLNSVSKAETIAHSSVVPDSGGAVLRVYLPSFGISKQEWDDLCRKGSGVVRVAKKVDEPEPYFHQVVQVDPTTKKVTRYREAQQYNAYGQLETVQQPYEVTEQVDGHKEVIHGPWIPPDLAAAYAKCVYSDYGIVRSDWFISKANISPAYEEILGFKEFDDFKKFVEFSDRIRDKRSVRGIVVDSQEVSHNQRAIYQFPSAYGVISGTQDFFTSVDKDDVMLDLFKQRFDAAEYIANGPNGMQYYLLTDGKDKIVSFGDPNVVAVRGGPWKVPLVYNAYSCMTCHNEGLKDVNDEVRGFGKPPVWLLARDKADYENIVRQFTPPLDGPPLQSTMGTGKELHRIAIARATGGMAPRELSAALQDVFITYVQVPISIEVAAAEVGCTVDELKETLIGVQNVDPRAAQLLAGRKIRRDQWESSAYSQAATLVYNRRNAK